MSNNLKKRSRNIFMDQRVQSSGQTSAFEPGAKRKKQEEDDGGKKSKRYQMYEPEDKAEKRERILKERESTELDELQLGMSADTDRGALAGATYCVTG